MINGFRGGAFAPFFYNQHMDAQLIGTVEELPFEPMKLEPSETYPKGIALDLTLREWLAAKGSGRYECTGDTATFKATFEDLIPQGLYTIWNFIDAEPAADSWQTLMWPLGKRDGSQRSGAATLDGIHHFELAEAQMAGIGGAPGSAVVAEDRPQAADDGSQLRGDDPLITQTPAADFPIMEEIVGLGERFALALTDGFDY